MGTFFELLVGIGFGIGGAAMGIVHSVVHSTIIAPPRQTRFNLEHAKVILLRLVCIFPTFLAIMLARPFRLAIDAGNGFVPILMIVFLFLVVIFGLRNVVPKFMKVTLTSEDLMRK